MAECQERLTPIITGVIAVSAQVLRAVGERVQPANAPMVRCCLKQGWRKDYASQAEARRDVADGTAC